MYSFLKNKIVVLGVIFSGVFFMPLFMHFIINIFYYFDVAPPSFLGMRFVYMPVFLIFYAFNYASIYYAVTILGIAVIVVALTWGKPHRMVSIVLVIGALSISIFPLVFSYQTAVIATDGYKLSTLTQPDGVMSSFAKYTAIIAECRPCNYKLLGWSEDNILYYESECGRNAPEFWAYTVDENVKPVNSVPENLIYEVFPNKEVEEWVYVSDFYPKNGERSYRSIVIRQHDALLSNNGDLALIARHLYGPEDVLVLQKDDRE